MDRLFRRKDAGQASERFPDHPSPGAPRRGRRGPEDGRRRGILCSRILAFATLALTALPATALAQTTRAQNSGSDERVDVLIIGASPSALAAAIAARRAGARRVAVVGAHPEPNGGPADRHNPVLLSMGSVQLVARLGVPVNEPQYVAPLGEWTGKTLAGRAAGTLHSTDHLARELVANRKRVATAGIANLERGLIDTVRRDHDGGIALHFERPVVAIRQHERGVVARVRDGDGRVTTIRASIAYVADGGDGPVATMLGVGRTELSAREMWGIGVYRKRGEGVHSEKVISDGRGGTVLAVRLDAQRVALNVRLPEGHDFSRAELRRLAGAGRARIRGDRTPRAARIVDPGRGGGRCARGARSRLLRRRYASPRECFHR